MGKSQTAMWTVVTLLIAALLAAGGYFLAIQPQIEATEEAHSEKQAAIDRNDQLDLQILAAQKKEQQVPLWQGEMNAIAIDLPPLPDQSKLHAMVVKALEDQGLPIVGIDYGSTQIITPPLTDEAAAAPVTPPVTGDGTDPAATPSPVPSPAPAEVTAPTDTAQSSYDQKYAVDGLVGIPVTVTTEGDPTAVMRFIAALQSQNERFLTVTNIEITRAQDVDEVDGRRALTTSDWTASVTYLAFSLIDPSKSFPEVKPGTNPPYIGGPVVNPFVPLDGSGL